MLSKALVKSLVQRLNEWAGRGLPVEGKKALLPRRDQLRPAWAIRLRTVLIDKAY